MHLFAQAIGGAFYLLNKIFFWLKERSESTTRKRLWAIRAWIVYLIGLPGWLYIFGAEENWIAFGVEAGGAPAMVLGLILALRGKGEHPDWLKALDYSSIAIAVTVGMLYSINVFGGITTFNQVLEIGLVVGFLAGTYLLARDRPSGYLWFVLMNGSNALLQGIQDADILMWQQIISLGIMVDTYRVQRQKSKAP